MGWTVSNTQIFVVSVIIIPCLAWGWHLESKATENTLNIKEVKKDVKGLEESISDMEDKLDKKSASDNANFLLVLQHISDLKVDLKDYY